jgi:hypothetical protein
VDRAFTHCSSIGTRRTELRRVQAELNSNGHPPSSFDRAVHQALNKFETKGTQAGGGERSLSQTKKVVLVPFYGDASQQVGRILAKHNLRPAFAPVRRMCSLLSRAKDPVPSDQKSNVVYKIPCKSCPMSYIGETGRRLVDRVYEHKQALRKMDIDKSALAEHAITHDHEVDWDKVEILKSCKSYAHRKVSETLEIVSNPSIINRADGLKLDKAYLSVL